VAQPQVIQKDVGANTKTMKNPNQKVSRLEKKETRLVSKGMKAVDEGREKKADRLFGRAAKTENRLIKAKKKGFPDVSGDGKVTKKDVLIAKGVLPKNKK